MSHAVSRLRAECVEKSRKPFVARGARNDRCPRCRVPCGHCLCAARPDVATHAGFCLLMHGDEPMKPSNTGWLVADVVADTHAFAWSRTEVDPRLAALLADPARRPYVVFPAAAAPERAVREVETPTDRRAPLFVVLDATWAEARKMFRKSPYLDALPVLGLDADSPSRYRLRRARLDTNLCTAEVAARCLRLADETAAADALDAWLDAYVDLTMRLRGR